MDVDHERGFEAAEKSGWEVCLIGFEELIQGDILKARREIDEANFLEKAVSLGWMMKPDIYEEFYRGLHAK